jgi:hypothetical protein
MPDSLKCQSLVRSRYVEVTRNVNGREIVVSEPQRLRNPEPCGELGTQYEVRQKARAQKEIKKKVKPGQEAFLLPVALPAGTMVLKQVFCEKHKRKAEREGLELKPV